MGKKITTNSGVLKEKELTEIQAQQTKVGSIIHRIGVLETEKHGLLHDIKEVNKTIEETKKTLEKKYGSVNINLETGKWERIKEDEDVEDKKD
tara:strand:- start:745 stop:1023 length:279 start_codon:yes stop_codon:yes gene_type:complete